MSRQTSGQWRWRFRALVAGDEVHAAVLELGGQCDEVLEKAAEPVKLGDDELVASAGGAQGVVELRSAGELAAGLVDDHPAAAAPVRASSCASGFRSREATRPQPIPAPMNGERG